MIVHHEYKVGSRTIRYCIEVDVEKLRITIYKEYLSQDPSNPNEWRMSVSDDTKISLRFEELAHLSAVIKKTIKLMNFL